MSQIDSAIDRLDELDVLIPRCEKTLYSFYDPKVGFTSRVGGGEVSVVSHGLCVYTLLASPGDFWPHKITDEERERWLDIFLNNRWATGRGANAHRDIAYADTFVIAALSKLCPHGSEIIAATSPRRRLLREKLDAASKRLCKAVGKIVSRKKEDRSPGEPLLHQMIYARIRWSLDLLLKAWPDLGLSVLDGKEGVEGKAGTLDGFLQTDFLDKLAMADALSDNRDEALRLGYLAYCVRTYGTFTNDVLLDHAVKGCLTSLFGERSVPRPQTIYTDKTRDISSTPFEVLRLLATLPNLTNKFSDYYSAFDRAFAWLKETQSEGWTNFKQAPRWRAEPWRSGGVESWLNAHVIDFLASYREVLSSVTGSALLVEFGANVKRPSVTWEKISELDGAKKRIQDELIEPIKPALPTKLANNVLPLKKASLILFGPPGTAKTTIAKALAARLEWPLITILPHHIAEEGLHGMVRRAHQVFRRLMVIREAVVFFDEVDELVRSRDQDTQAPDKVGRVITTCMLPWFQNLHEKGQLVFIVATNNITSFDPAIKRLGLFVYLIPRPPPRPAELKPLLGES